MRPAREATSSRARRARLEADARRARRARAALLSAVAHDVRAQLAAVTMAASALARDESLREDQRRKLGFVQRAAKRIERLVDDLSDVGRLEAGALALELAPERVASVVDEVVALLQPIAAERGVCVVASVTGASTVCCARRRIVQVLDRLGSSAVSATPRGGTVRVRAELRGDRAWFAVDDERLGAPADDHEGAAGVADTPRGVDLAVAAGLVRAHGGELRGERRGEGGMTFRFDLPIDGRGDEAGGAGAAGDEARQVVSATRARARRPRCER
ncbi:MAG: HAMP domain-containing histidine kinase [Labilithrix sp.]|nr:HAMP domain-containing histidine kinase [Labilithrix sp.]